MLAENLATVFGRPAWDVSMYVNVDAAALIGADTLKDGQVIFREGPVCACARLGGFGVLDEVNMAKNEALAVLHATLDFRRVIDVPGYQRIQLDDAARFIGTMNYGYAGTRELNEALVSRFVVLDMPVISEENLQKLLRRTFPALSPQWAEQFAALFRDLRQKYDGGEITTKALDLRGLLSALHLVEKGISTGDALRLGIINKAFDPSSASWWPMPCGRASPGRRPRPAVHRLIWTGRNYRPAGARTRSGTAQATTPSSRITWHLTPAATRSCTGTPSQALPHGATTSPASSPCSTPFSSSPRATPTPRCSFGAGERRLRLGAAPPPRAGVPAVRLRPRSSRAHPPPQSPRTPPLCAVHGVARCWVLPPRRTTGRRLSMPWPLPPEATETQLIEAVEAALYRYMNRPRRAVTDRQWAASAGRSLLRRGKSGGLVRPNALRGFACTPCRWQRSAGPPRPAGLSPGRHP